MTCVHKLDSAFLKNFYSKLKIEIDLKIPGRLMEVTLRRSSNIVLRSLVRNWVSIWYITRCFIVVPLYCAKKNLSL